MATGYTQVGSPVVVIPTGEAGTIKTLEEDKQLVQLARAGDRVDVSLAGIDASMLTAGAVLCHPDWAVPLVTMVEVRVLVLDVEVPILRGQQVGFFAPPPPPPPSIPEFLSFASSHIEMIDPYGSVPLVTKAEVCVFVLVAEVPIQASRSPTPPPPPPGAPHAAPPPGV